MKALYWNAHGIGNLDTRLVLKRLCTLHKPDFLFIFEPWIFIDQSPSSFWRNLNLKPFVVNDRNGLKPNIWGFCVVHFDHVVISNSAQQVSLSVLHDSQVQYLSAVYASTDHSIRRQLWFELATLQDNFPGPQLFIGDFNSVLGAHEKRDGNLLAKISCDEFKGWTDGCNLTHILTRGADRSICNDECLAYWNSLTCCTLTRSHSDHFPLLVNLQKGC